MSVSTNNSTVTNATGNVWQKGIFAVVVTTVVNVLIYFIGIALGIQYDVTSPTGPLAVPVTAVVLFTVVPMLVGVIVYWALNRTTSQAKRIFTILMVLVILVSFFPTYMAAQNTGAMLTLSLMHIVPGIAFYWYLLR